MIWLAFPAFVILGVRFLIVLVNLITRESLKDGEMDEQPLVSILIPARNEALTLPVIMDDILKQDYENFEAIIYDDSSEDATSSIAEEYAARDPRISWIGGKELPEGWNGKNHACHQLAQRAKGRYLLFLDADVRIKAGLIRKALIYTEKHRIALLSLFPKQEMLSFGEKLTVPVMNWILLSLLPMSLIRRSHYPSLSAANGQFMLFVAAEYRTYQFHEQVKDKNVEDIHIMRLIKKLGHKGSTLLSDGGVECRMYRSFKEGIFGFTRSMFAFFGGSGITLFFFTVFTTFGIIFAAFGISWFFALIYGIVAVLMRAIIAYMSRQPVLKLILLAPLQQLVFFVMVIESFRRKSKGVNIWKGRIIKYESQ